MRLYYGTYGHHLSGKLYVYWGDDNLRTGEQVVAPVTNKKSGKTYNTMFTIARAQGEKNAQGEVSRLNEQGIFIKTIGGRETLSLPGGKDFDTKISWKRDSDKRYRKRFGLPEPATQTKASSSRRTADRQASASPRLPGSSAPVIRPTSQRKNAVNNQNARSSLLSRKKTPGITNTQKERIRAMSIKNRSKE